MRAEIQSIYFMTPRWNQLSSKAWLRLHGFRPIKRVHINGRQLRYRITPPEQYDHFITRRMHTGVYFVIGFA